MVMCHDRTDLNCGIISFEKTFLTQGQERGGRSAHPERDPAEFFKVYVFLAILNSFLGGAWTKVHPGGDG